MRQFPAVTLNVQVPSPLQLSAEQASPSSQLYAVPPQVPAVQMSFLVHAFPSLQAVPSATFKSAGHEAPVPVQFSALSHAPAAGRHTVAALAKPSCGHAALAPVQVSATSHTPAEARQIVAVGWKASVGQASEDPSQGSAASQIPANARHTVPLVSGVQIPR